MTILKSMIGLLALALLTFTGLTLMQNQNHEGPNSTLSDTEYEIKVEVTGMHCSRCVSSCERSLNKLEQVKKADVRLDEELAFIKLKEDQTVTKERITEAIESAGFEAGAFKKFPGNSQTEER